MERVVEGKFGAQGLEWSTSGWSEGYAFALVGSFLASSFVRLIALKARMLVSYQKTVLARAIVFRV